MCIWYIIRLGWDIMATLVYFEWIIIMDMCLPEYAPSVTSIFSLGPVSDCSKVDSSVITTSSWGKYGADGRGSSSSCLEKTTECRLELGYNV